MEQVIFWSLLSILYGLFFFLEWHRSCIMRKVSEKNDETSFRERFEMWEREGGREYARRMADYELHLMKSIAKGRGGPIPPPPEPPKDKTKNEDEKD